MIYKLKGNITCIFVFYFMFTSLFVCLFSFVTKTMQMLLILKLYHSIAGLYSYSKYQKNIKQVSLWLIQTDRAHAELLAAKDVKELSHAGLCSAVVPSTHCYMSLLIREWQLVVKGVRKTKLTTASPYVGCQGP